MSRLVCIGEAMAELRFTDSGTVLGYGGDTFNTAVYAARLLDGPVGYLTRIGTDPLSDGLLKLASGEGLAEDGFIRDPDRNIGIYAVVTDAQGERSFVYWRGESAARRLFSTQEDLDRIPQAEILYLSGITLAILSPAARTELRQRLAVLKKHGVRIAFDSNYRPRLWNEVTTARDEISAMWTLTDIALPSLDDEIALHGGSEDEIMARLNDAGCVLGALKRGMDGPLPLSGKPHGPYPAVKPVDTTAAGDAFNAAYLAALLKGKPEVECLSAGHSLAAQVVTRPGAIVPTE